MYFGVKPIIVPFSHLPNPVYYKFGVIQLSPGEITSTRQIPTCCKQNLESVSNLHTALHICKHFYHLVGAERVKFECNFRYKTEAFESLFNPVWYSPDPLKKSLDLGVLVFRVPGMWDACSG